MKMQSLIEDFISSKGYKPLNDDQLLDFAQTRYLYGGLSIIEYRTLLHDLEARGAVKPEYQGIGELLDVQ